MLTGHLNATRFAQKPLPQPSYNFADVPKAERDLRGSQLQCVADRDAFHGCMAEMLLLCKEALRRRRDTAPLHSQQSKQGGSKPLSLEYLADRCDVDDPIFGYLVRTDTSDVCPRNRKWERGMLQGFVTVTTFTNYQKTFKWDSHSGAAFSFDDEELALLRTSGRRAWDDDDSLASELQSTVRCGDVWNEGIVWPRIAEISLLGGLGCGRALVALVIEHLECMKASGKCNYDYVVLQATDNSISFYESMGFIRVGAVAKEENLSSSSASASSSDEDDDDYAPVAEPIDEGSPEKPNAIARNFEIVSSDVTTCTTKKAGETPNDLAKRCQVDVWDIIFLNKDLYPDIVPSSRLLVGTVLHVPAAKKPAPTQSTAKPKSQNGEAPQWYAAKENETPRMIARKFEVSCLDLVEANKGRLDGLVSNSRLKEGTRIKVSHLDVVESDYKPYAHWSFPDDQFEDGEPSYMMARRLNRRKGNASRVRPFLESLAVPVSEYEPTDLVVPPSPLATDNAEAGSATAEHPVAPAAKPASKKRPPHHDHPDAPQPPKRALSGYMLYLQEEREKRRRQFQGRPVSEATKIIAGDWNNLSDAQKAPYEKVARAEREKYMQAKEKYLKDLEAFRKRTGLTAADAAPAATKRAINKAPKLAAMAAASGPMSASMIKQTLFNKVVRLKAGAMTEGSEYTYWYVLTFIPDLKWCHLAPMIEVGTFGNEKAKTKGRPKWMLVDESEGKEVDISSSFCVPIKSRSMKKTLDADKEEWDIIDDGSDPTAVTASTLRSQAARVVVRGSGEYDSDDTPSDRLVNRQSLRTSTATKPSAERKRKCTAADLPRLIATLPGANEDTYVRLAGARLYDPSFPYPVRRKIGRPKGSLGRLKDPPSPATASRYSSSSSSSSSSRKARTNKKKRGRGRPKGSKNKAKTPPLPSAEDPYRQQSSALVHRGSSPFASARRGLGGSRGSVSVPASARKKWGTCQTTKTKKRGRNDDDDDIDVSIPSSSLSRRPGRSLERTNSANNFPEGRATRNQTSPTRPRRAAGAARPSPKVVRVRVGGKRRVVKPVAEQPPSDDESFYGSPSDGEASPSVDLRSSRHLKRAARSSIGAMQQEEAATDASTQKKRRAKRKKDPTPRDDDLPSRKRRKVNCAGSPRRSLLVADPSTGRSVCRRCHQGPSFKQGHAHSCPQSQHYTG